MPSYEPTQMESQPIPYRNPLHLQLLQMTITSNPMQIIPQE